MQVAFNVNARGSVGGGRGCGSGQQKSRNNTGFTYLTSQQWAKLQPETAPGYSGPMTWDPTLGCLVPTSLPSVAPGQNDHVGAIEPVASSQSQHAGTAGRVAAFLSRQY